MSDYIKKNDVRHLLLHNDREAAIAQLDELESVDAVPVVRCGECIHRYVDGENVRFNVCELNHNKVQADDWFCADGEQKDLHELARSYTRASGKDGEHE